MLLPADQLTSGCGSKRSQRGDGQRVLGGREKQRIARTVGQEEGDGNAACE
jgi:hypothetical protein